MYIIYCMEPNTDQQTVPTASPIGETNQPQIIPNVTPVPTKKPSFLLPVLLVLLAIVSGGSYYLYTQNNTVAPETAVLPTEKPSMFLTLATGSGTVSGVGNEVLISGTTLPNSTVLLYSDTDQTSVDADATGAFEETVLVDNSDGLVRVQAISQDGLEMEKTLAITLPAIDVLGKSDSKTNNGKNDTIKESNANKTTNTNKPADISPTQKIKSTTIQGQIKKPTPKSNISVITEPTKAKKEAIRITTSEKVKNTGKIGTLAIKNMLRNASESGTASLSGEVKKFAVKQASPAAQMKRHAVSGIISGLADGEITLVHQIQRERTYTVFYTPETVVHSKSSDTPMEATLTLGMRIAVVGELSDAGELIAKRIHIIPGKAVGIFSKQPLSTQSGEQSASPSTTISVSPSATGVVTPSVVPTETIIPATPVPTTENELPQ